MKNTKLLLSAALLTGVAFFTAGCKKDGTSGTPGIAYALKTSNRSSTVGRVESGNIVWTSGFGNATEIKFEGKGPNGEIEFKTPTQQRIDLFSGIANLGNVTLPPGTYREVEFEVELNPTATEPALELTGTYSNGGPVIPVIFRVQAPLEIKTERDNVVVNGSNSYQALTTLNLSLLSRGISQSMMDNAVRTNGAILISPSVNANLYSIILHNLEESDEVEFEDH